MTCRSDSCCQGRKPCPTPGYCSDSEHPHLIETEGGATVSGGNYYLPLDQPTVTPDDVYGWIPVVVAGLFLLAAVCAAVFFSMRPEPIWPIFVAGLSI